MNTEVDYFSPTIHDKMPFQKPQLQRRLPYWLAGGVRTLWVVYYIPPSVLEALNPEKVYKSHGSLLSN